jgi:hypothetical protein
MMPMSLPSIRTILGSVAIAASASATALAEAPPPWTADSYPDETGYRERMDGMLERIAETDFLRRAMSPSVCPDTGLPVFTWAIEGEEIVSPYTGRRYRQGPTGYFGARTRDDQGRITAFGGDPLKQSLPPAAATLLLAKQAGETFAQRSLVAEPTPAGTPRIGPPATPAELAFAYLSIPGNLRQHYHFASVNWARFLPLVGDAMPPQWHEAFRAAVATYEENRRPSDGVREYQPLPRTETLVGVEEELLGGGGTENHKTMWRSSGLLYAQLLPEGSRISGFTRDEAMRRTSVVLERYVRKLFTVGNGEYDSSTYYPFSIRGFLNLYDFSPDPAVRAWSKAALDYYVATYGLKVFNGVHTGPQRRGWVDGGDFGEMERHLWAWAGGQPGYTTVPVDRSRFVTTMHQATTTYRPDRLLVDILAKQVPRPFEARLNHPDYGMSRPGRQPEYFFCSDSFAMGSVQMDMVGNSAQQTTWSLVVRAARGSLVFGGGQPRWLHPEGHSPYDQWVQHRGALLLMTGATATPPGGPAPRTLRSIDELEGPRGYTRQTAFSGPLDPAGRPPADAAAFAPWFEGQRSTAASWLFVPREATVREMDGRWLIEAEETVVLVTPFNRDAFWIEAPAGSSASAVAKVLERYRVLVVPGVPAGFAIEAVERRDFADADRAREARLELDGSIARYRSLAGSTLELRYQADRLRGVGLVDGVALDWDHWAGGAVCASPWLTIKDGRMRVTNGTDAYELDYTEDAPVWRNAAP